MSPAKAAKSSRQGASKIDRYQPEPFKTRTRTETIYVRPAHNLVAESSRIVAEAASKATGKGMAPGVTEEAFKEAWSALHEAAQTLLKEAETALDTLPERIQLQPTLRADLVAHLKAQLQLALMPPADVIMSVQQATPKPKPKPKPKAAKEGKSKDGGSASGRGRKVQIKPELLKSAYAKLRQFQYELIEACAGNTQDYLSAQEIKQLTITAGIYDANNSNKMKMIAALMKTDALKKVKSSAAAADEVLEMDEDENDDDDEDGEEDEEDEEADNNDNEEEDEAADKKDEDDDDSESDDE